MERERGAALRPDRQPELTGEASPLPGGAAAASKWTARTALGRLDDMTSLEE